MTDPIKKITLKNGKTRYRFVVDIGLDAEGKRKQLTVTKDTKKEAVNERARIISQRAAGTYVAPSKATLGDVLDMWLKTVSRNIEETSSIGYATAVMPIREHSGHRRVQQLTEEDVEQLVDWMLAAGRRRNASRGPGLHPQTVRIALVRLRAALSVAVRRGIVVRNVALDVHVPREAAKKARTAKAQQKPWNQEEVRAFLDAIRGERLYPPMLLSLIAERPAEVCGLRWAEHVDLDAGTVAISNTRTLIYDRTAPFGQRTRVVEKDTKTEAGDRALPLPAPVLRGLKAFRALQARERLAAGDGYENSGYVLVDELGRPFRTDKLRREAYKLMRKAEVRQVRLYDARHACLSWMANNGVPDTVVSAWAGHTDLGFTKKVYVHPDPESLRAGSDKLAELLG